MFSTVLGRLPRPSTDPPPEEPDARRAADDAAIRAVLEAQAAAGVELLADGGLRPPLDLSGPDPVAIDAWRFASEAAGAGRAVKAVLPGPLTLAADGGANLGAAATQGAAATLDGSATLAADTVRLAERLRAEVEALAAAGCPLVEIEEPAALSLGAGEAALRAFAEAHRRLAADAPVHLSLALGSGNLAPEAYRVILDTAYASYAVDLVAGPDNWRLVVDIPGDRGVVCGGLRPVEGSDDSPELLVWAAHYAASMRRRGLDRVGLANAPGLERLPWEVAQRKFDRLAEAAHIAALPRRGGQLRAALDPRATDLKSRAAGRHVPKRGRATR